MTHSILNDLITHTVAWLADMDVSFGKTKLVKLLYLIDVENYRRRRSTLSGLEWRFYHYGPYAFEIDDALESLSLDIPQESFKTEQGHKVIVFSPPRNLYPMLGKYIRPSQLDLVNRIINEWGDVELNPLLNHVYFYTEPMKNAKRGEVLDFSTIQRRKTQRKVADVQLPPDRLNKYRARFKEVRAQRTQRTLYPAPRFDKVYMDGLAGMNGEERSGIPLGDVHVSEDMKAHIRAQRDE